MQKIPVRVHLRWVFYALLLLLLYTMQTTPGLFGIAGVRPALVAPAALAIAIYENELAGAIYGAVAGLMWDLSAMRLSGFNGVILCVLCVACSFFFIFWVRKTVLNASLVCALALLIQCGLDYLFNFFFFYKDSLYILTRQLLPGTLYTALCCPLILLAVLGIRRACLRGEGT